MIEYLGVSCAFDIGRVHSILRIFLGLLRTVWLPPPSFCGAASCSPPKEAASTQKQPEKNLNIISNSISPCLEEKQNLHDSILHFFKFCIVQFLLWQEP